MRNINPAALAKIAQTEGTDPLVLVQIFWTEDSSIIYGDRQVVTDGVRGLLLNVGDIENVVNTTQGSNTGSLAIQLDDTSGELKTIYDAHDIHKRPVYVLQWFPDLPLANAFILFDGVISSPIVWNETDRTLAFEVLSKVESLEVGYSADEGNFEFIPQNLVGRTWPLFFGKVLQVPAIQINLAPAGNNLTDTGFSGLNGDGTLNTPLEAINNEQRLTKEQLNACVIYCLMQAESYDYASDEYSLKQFGVFAPRVNLGQGIGLPGSDGFLRDMVDSSLSSLLNQADEWRARAGQYATLAAYGYPNTFQGGNYTGEDKAKMDALANNQLPISGGSNFPQRVNTIITINGAQHEGYFEGDIFNIVSKTHPFTDQSAVTGPTTIVDKGVATEHLTDIAAGSFFYAIAGSDVKVSSGTSYPIYYIVGCPYLTNVVAYGKYKGKVTLVPRAYYSLQYKTFGTLQTTLLIMGTPLSARDGWDGDDIWCSAQSPVGPNGVDILTYLIQNYTDATIDTVSFTEVRPLVNPYQCNFAILERQNCYDLLKDIAYQLRCAIWYKGGRFYLKYLPMMYDPVATITEDDVEAGTLKIQSTDTEDVTTKFTVTWKEKQSQDKSYSVIYRYHVKKYGLLEKTFDAFCFNTLEGVKKFALFWLIRNANTWKKIEFSTFLTKLALEPFDSVLIDFDNPFVSSPDCTTPVIGIIEKASYNSETKRIDLIIWLPIRLGEMCPYDFAYPAGLDTTYVYPTEQEVKDGSINTGIPGSGASGQLFDQIPIRGLDPINTTPTESWVGGNRPVGDSNDHTTQGSANFNPPTELSPDAFVNTGAPTAQTRVRQLVLKTIPDAPPAVEPGVFPGEVVSQKSGNDYFVNVYFDGLLNPPTEMKVTQLRINEGDIIPAGTPTMVTRAPAKSASGLYIPEYTMQVPVWLKVTVDEAADDIPVDVPIPDPGTAPVEEEEPAPEADEGDEVL